MFPAWSVTPRRFTLLACPEKGTHHVTLEQRPAPSLWQLWDAETSVGWASRPYEDNARLCFCGVLYTNLILEANTRARAPDTIKHKTPALVTRQLGISFCRSRRAEGSGSALASDIQYFNTVC